MIVERKEQIHTEHPEWVLDALDREQLANAKQHKRMGKRHLGRSLVVLMWLLRVYVVLMLLLVVHQILATLIH